MGVPEAVRSVLDTASRELTEAVAHERIPPRAKTYVQEVVADVGVSDVVRGDTIVHNILRDLDSFDTETYYLTQHQRNIQRGIVEVCLPQFYGPSFKQHAVEIRRRWGFVRQKQVFFISMPRRGGKTESVAQACATIIRHLPNAYITCIGPTIRAAGGESSITDRVAGILSNHYKLKVEKNDERVRVVMGPRDKRRMFSYSASAGNK